MRRKVTINIASYKRPVPLLKTMESLIDQCDVMNVALNNEFATEGPVKLLRKFFKKHDKKVNVLQCDNTYGDGARYLFDKPKGWLLTVDDDITYPPTYVSHLIRKANEYGPVLITVHGTILKPGKRGSLLFPEDRLAKYPCLGFMAEDKVVEIGGTGVMCWNVDDTDFYPDVSRFERKNMADLWVAVQAKAADIPIVCIAHEHGWLQYHLPHGWNTIWHESFWSSEEGRVVNEEMAKYHAGIINRYLR